MLYLAGEIGAKHIKALRKGDVRDGREMVARMIHVEYYSTQRCSSGKKNPCHAGDRDERGERDRGVILLGRDRDIR